MKAILLIFLIHRVLHYIRITTDASGVLTVKNAQGYITFSSFNINAYNTSNDSSSLLLLNTANGNGCYGF